MHGNIFVAFTLHFGSSVLFSVWMYKVWCLTSQSSLDWLFSFCVELIGFRMSVWSKGDNQSDEFVKIERNDEKKKQSDEINLLKYLTTCKSLLVSHGHHPVSCAIWWSPLWYIDTRGPNSTTLWQCCIKRICLGYVSLHCMMSWEMLSGAKQHLRLYSKTVPWSVSSHYVR